MKKVFNDNVTKGLLTVNNAAAYRHALWNAYTVRDYGSDYAKRFADAHELDFPNPGLEKEMDLYNNSKGRSIGCKNYSGNNESTISYQIRRNVIQAIENGEMERDVGTDIGSLNYLIYTNNTLLIETNQYGWALKNNNWYWYENGQLAKSV
ncbi:hypothetical protein H8S20_16555 [Clostridium sp. NSJ-6]|uniref:DUF6973 domain-containing protein n=1 Tax=Clostridium hominis TaxID=2763036 RepID=A0ABR7DGK2_9CLOT|nr:hypothetical protein [Clostridium hominis]MBC5630472.1 hypothetical protein [Clostridium hominis]